MTRILRAAGALCVLLLLVIGVPIALVQWGRWPISGVPTWDQIQDLPNTLVSDTAVFGALTLAAWAVWVLFVASVLLEIAANASGWDAPRLPLAGPLQRNARQLVAAVLMTASVAGPLARSAASQPLPPAPTAVPVPEAASAPLTAGQPPPPPATPTPSDVGPQIEVRRGDSPWELAERHLGDPMRWREIWDLNRGRGQPDGRAWVVADLIEPGWLLTLPADARDVPTAVPPNPYTVVPGDTLSEIAAAHLGDADRAMEIFEINRSRPQPDGETLTDPDLIRPGWQLTLPGPAVTPPVQADDAATPPPAAATPPAPDTAEPTTTAPPPTNSEPDLAPVPEPGRPTAGVNDAATDTDDDRTPVGLIGGGVAAAGLVLLLERRRRAQHRRRRSGDPPPIAPADLQQAERFLRATAQPDSLRTIDAALRAATAGSGQLPGISHVEVSGNEILIVLLEPAPAPPGFVSASERRWQTVASPAELEAVAAATGVPLPVLCPIGTTPSGAEVLVDLESAPVTTIVGDQRAATELLSSMVASIATAPWSGHPRILTVGIDAPLLTDGAERCPSQADAIRQCSDRAAKAESALRSSAHASAVDARIAGTTPDAWEPVVVLSAQPPSQTDLEVFATFEPHRAVAVCSMSATRFGRVLEVDADGSIRTEGVDTALTANRLRAPDASAAGRLLEDAAAEKPSPVPADLPPPARVPTARPAHHEEASESSNGERPKPLTDDIDVLVRVLGEVEAVRLGPAGEEPLTVPKQRALEAITYLALRESSVDREDVQAALWPDGANSAKSFSNAMWEARRALGNDAHGSALLPDASGGRYSLSERVVTDYGLFCELAAHADEIEDAQEAAAHLEEALRLVRGEPFIGVGRSYAWVGPHRGMIVAQVLDAAEELAEVRLATGDWRAAEWAARQGLRAMPCDERMYRLLMRAAHLAGNTAGVHRAFKELWAAVADLDTGAEPDDTVHPDTVALLEQLTKVPPRRVTA